MYIVSNDLIDSWVDQGSVYFVFGCVTINVSLFEFYGWVNTLIDAEQKLELGNLPTKVKEDKISDLSSSSEINVWMDDELIFVDCYSVTMSVPKEKFGLFVDSLLTTRQKIDKALKDIHLEK